MLLTITDVEYLGDYTLLCTFSTGDRRKVDLTPLLSYPAFEELRDKKESDHLLEERCRHSTRKTLRNGADCIADCRHFLIIKIMCNIKTEMPMDG